jgi:hypothetical protein
MLPSTFLPQLRQAAVTTYKRFPFVIATAITCTVLSILLEQKDYSFTSTPTESFLHIYAKVLMCGALGIPLFFAAAVFEERKFFKLQYKFNVGSMGVILFLFGYYFTLSTVPNETDFIRYVVLALAAHLLVAFSPFVAVKEDNGFWQYNKALFLTILLSMLYTYVLYGGLSIALASLDALFNISVSSHFYFYLWVVLQGIFNTWFFLSQIPPRLADLEQKEAYPIGLKIFTQYVLLPLVSIYLLILYGYLVKIILEWNLPQGSVSYLVLCFSVAGIFALLLIYPVRNSSDNKWIPIYDKIFYFALIPLVGVLFAAVYVRINAHGITENRYFVALLAFWLLGNTIYRITRKETNIKVIPISLCILAVLSSFGWWGAFQVSTRNQTNRFVKTLEANNLLKNGVIVNNGEVPNKVENQLSGIARYLADRNELAKIAPYFGAADTLINANNKQTNLDSLFSAVGLRYLDYRYNNTIANDTAINTDNYYISTSISNQLIDLQGYDYLIYYYRNDAQFAPIQFTNDSSKFELTYAYNDTLGTISYRDFIVKILASETPNNTYINLPNTEAATLLFEDQNIRAKIIFRHVIVERYNRKRQTGEVQPSELQIFIQKKCK